MTVSEVGRIAMCSSSSDLPLIRVRRGSRFRVQCKATTHALVTQATSGAKPSMWSFSFSNRDCETNMGK